MDTHTKSKYVIWNEWENKRLLVYSSVFSQTSVVIKDIYYISVLWKIFTNMGTFQLNFNYF